MSAYQGPLKCCVAGDAAVAVQYAQERVLPVVQRAMADTCLHKSEHPLTDIQKMLKCESELRTARVTDVEILMPPAPPPPHEAIPEGPPLTGGRRASHPGAGEKESGHSSSSSSRAPLPVPTVTAAAAAVSSGSSPHKTAVPLHYESRPTLLTKPKDFSHEVADGTAHATSSPVAQDAARPVPSSSAAVLPRTFHRCGEYPVFLSEVPPKSMLSTLARAVRDADASITNITWVLVSTDATVATYFGEQPYKARIPEGHWADLKRRCSRAGFYVPAPAATATASGDESSQQTTTPAKTPRRKSHATPRAGAGVTPRAVTKEHLRRLPVDDALLEQLINAEVAVTAGRKGNASSVCDCIRATAAATASTTPPAGGGSQLLGVPGGTEGAHHHHHRHHGGGGTSVEAFPSLIRLFHPSNTAVSKTLIETIWSLLERSTATPNNAFVVLSVDQMPLAQHIATLMCLYYRTKSDVDAWRVILNATERLRDRNYVYDFEKIELEVRRKREKRDDTRRMLREAQLKQFTDAGLAQSAAEFTAKWEAMHVWHKERREQEDERRHAVDAVQGGDAAVRVQSIIRGAMARRKTFGVLRKVKREIKDLEGPYRRGRYPIVDATMEYLSYVFGAAMITSEPMKRGQTKSAMRWKRTKVRVPPQDIDNDISSEEEQWEQETFEKVFSEGTGAINPLHMADVCMSATASLDKDILYDAYVNYPGVHAVQEKAFRGAMERMVHYITVAVYWSARHRVREGHSNDSGPYASTNLLDMPIKLKNCLTYDQFTTEYRRPQEWLNHPQFSLLLLTNIPQPLQRSRLLIANPKAPNGAFVEGVGRADVFLPQSPIFVVPEGSTVDQWAEGIASIQRAGVATRCKKVLWISASPNYCVYVNGVPVYFVERQNGALYSPKAALAADVAAPLVASVVTATATKPNANRSGATGGVEAAAHLTTSEEVVVESVDPADRRYKRNVGGGAKASPFALSEVALSEGSIYSPQSSPQSTSLAAATPHSRERRSPSVASLEVPSTGSPRVHQPTLEYGSSSTRAPMRRASSVVTDMAASAARKHDPSGWYSISWDQVEAALVDELTERIDHPKHDGYLTCFSLNHPRLEAQQQQAADTNPVATTEPLWAVQHCLELRRFEPPTVDVFDIRVTQQPVALPTAHSRASRSSRSSSQHVTPRPSVGGGSSSFLMGANSLSSRPSMGTNHRAQATTSPDSVLSRRKPRSVGRRGSMSSRRSSEIGGSSANSNTVEEPQDPSEALPTLPILARDALRTPCQAVDDVRDKLKAASCDCTLIYRRLPMLTPFGDEWLRNLDTMLTQYRDSLLDTQTSVAVCVSSPTSVWYALFACVLWESHVKHVAPRRNAAASSSTLANNASLTGNGGVENGSLTGATGAQTAAGDGLPITPADVAATSGKDVGSPVESLMEHYAGEVVQSYAPTDHATPEAGSLSPQQQRTATTSIAPSLAQPPPSSALQLDVPTSPTILLAPLDEFPVLRAMGEEIPQLHMESSVSTVMTLLYRTGTKGVMYDAIFNSMSLADDAAARLDWRACKHHCLEATVAFQRFAILLTFNAFVLYQAQDAAAQQQQTLSQRISQHKATGHKGGSRATYFREFLLSTPQLYHRLHHIHMWEGHPTRVCPLGEPASVGFLGEAFLATSSRLGITCLDGDHRWRLDVVMPNFS